MILTEKRMSKSELQKILKSFFPNLEEESLDAFMKHASYLKSTKGTKLISEGKRHRYFYLILNGGVKSYYSKESTRSMHVVRIRKGSYWNNYNI